MPELAVPRPAALAPYAGLALAVVFVGSGLVEQLARADTEHSLLALAWILAVGAPVLVARTRPVAATCATALLVAVSPDFTGAFPPSALAYVLPVVLSYCCGAYAATRPGLLATLALVTALQIHIGFADAPNLEIAIATLPPWWCGQEVRRRRRLVRDLADQTRALEAEEEAFVRLSVERERARIARDLHDIVSHHLAVIVIQAGAGRLADPWRAGIAADRFMTIRNAGVEALTEADRLVTLLEPDGTDAPCLVSLLDRARAIGAHVVTPPDLVLALELEAVAHHVTREALTNAMKHAPGATLEIRVELDDRALVITARNEKAAVASSITDTGSGLGLQGMRERLAALGGTLEAGHDSNGAFRLKATLPLQPDPSRDLTRSPSVACALAPARREP